MDRSEGRGDPNADRALLDRVLQGDNAATRKLIAAVLPIVQARVARALSRRKTRSSRDARQEVEDLSQEVFASLFENDARVLRAWDPSRGLALGSFCGLIAEREAASILRSGRRSPWTEDATDAEDLEREAGIVAGAELHVASRQHLDRLVERLREELSPRGLEMFQRLIVEEESVEAVCRTTGMSTDSVYAWRSRLGKLARKLAAELLASDPNLKVARNDGGLSGPPGSPRRTDERRETPDQDGARGKPNPRNQRETS